MQVKRMQENGTQVALRRGCKTNTLAQRRAELEARMREMATDDLQQVATRLKQLYEELCERESGWTYHRVADKNNIAPRTFASWMGGEVENRDGEGYRKLARFYSRKLGRKITREWIVFGEEGPKPKPADSPLDKLSEKPVSASEVSELRDQLDRIEQYLAQLLAAQGLESDEPPFEQEGRKQNG